MIIMERGMMSSYKKSEERIFGLASKKKRYLIGALSGVGCMILSVISLFIGLHFQPFFGVAVVLMIAGSFITRIYMSLYREVSYELELNTKKLK